VSINAGSLGAVVWAVAKVKVTNISSAAKVALRFISVPLFPF
jgi:hypothetical protein